MASRIPQGVWLRNVNHDPDDQTSVSYDVYLLPSSEEIEHYLETHITRNLDQAAAQEDQGVPGTPVTGGSSRLGNLSTDLPITVESDPSLIDRPLLERLLERLLPADYPAESIRDIAARLLAGQPPIEQPGGQLRPTAPSFTPHDATTAQSHYGNVGNMFNNTGDRSFAMPVSTTERQSGSQLPQPASQYQPGRVIRPRLFHPMEIRLRPNDTYSTTTPQQADNPHIDALQRVVAGFSPNYRGNINVASNRSADIPDSENCSLFITHLPPTITITQLLGAVQNTGRVFSTVINPPEHNRGHPAAAAKLTFFERRAAERFYYRNISRGFRIPGHPQVGRVAWNRVKVAPSTLSSNHTRVLMIQGPRHIVNPGYLTNYFNSKFAFEIDAIVDPGFEVLEYRFGSFRAQAEAARMAIERELLGLGVTVWFGRDPCDRVI